MDKNYPMNMYQHSFFALSFRHQAVEQSFDINLLFIYCFFLYKEESQWVLNNVSLRRAVVVVVNDELFETLNLLEISPAINAQFPFEKYSNNSFPYPVLTYYNIQICSVLTSISYSLKQNPSSHSSYFPKSINNYKREKYLEIVLFLCPRIRNSRLVINLKRAEPELRTLSEIPNIWYVMERVVTPKCKIIVQRQAVIILRVTVRHRKLDKGSSNKPLGVYGCAAG
ncbi:hypothetical protein H8356DRAFT_1349049 [Neocallimastix lanati (nom. inval.)]|nr:hypothetical protein H8356DRAFT_1349049 [Neocallimastix sp. JGI-2020a]